MSCHYKRRLMVFCCLQESLHMACALGELNVFLENLSQKRQSPNQIQHPFCPQVHQVSIKRQSPTLFEKCQLFCVAHTTLCLELAVWPSHAVHYPHVIRQPRLSLNPPPSTWSHTQRKKKAIISICPFTDIPVNKCEGSEILTSFTS